MQRKRISGVENWSRDVVDDFRKDGDDDDDNEVEIGTNMKLKNIGKVWLLHLPRMESEVEH